MKRAKVEVFDDNQIVRVCKKGTLGNLPVGAIGQVLCGGIGGKGKLWYGVRFLCAYNPHGFMDLTMWEGEIRGLTKREQGESAKRRKP